MLLLPQAKSLSLVSAGWKWDRQRAMSPRTSLVAAAAVATFISAWLIRVTRPRKNIKPRSKLLPRGQLLSSAAEVSILTYNVLCQKFATRQRLPHVFPRWLEWEHRWRLLREELATFMADVVCLQEVTPDRWDEIKAFMETLGYASVLQTKALAHGSHNVVATFYRAAKLRMIWQEERSRALLLGVELLLPEDSVLAHTPLWVVNVHLEGSPYRPNDRVSQMKSALQRLQLHLQTEEACTAANVAIVGDFNSTAHDSPCWLLRRGRLEGGHTDAICPSVPTTKQTIAHPFALMEAYEAAGVRLAYTRKTNTHSPVIDFLWVSRHLHISAVMRPLQAEQRAYVEQQFLPNRNHPSDHLPLGAVIRLKPATSAVEPVDGETVSAAVAAADMPAATVTGDAAITTAHPAAAEGGLRLTQAQNGHATLLPGGQSEREC